MRVIEKKMIYAVKHNTNMSVSNTTVSNGSVFLFGIKIAEVSEGSVHITNCDGWRSNTTKSRINALLNGLGISQGVYQRNYEWFWSDGGEFAPRTFAR